MKELEITVSDISQLPGVAQAILHFTKGKKIFAFDAPMGAGKTTLIKEICKQLGSADHFSSPSYSIVNEYLIPNSSTRIYHIDLYRIKNIEEALGAGIEEYLNGEHYCFIEWADRIEPLLPVETVKIGIEMHENLRNVAIFIN